MNRMDNILQLGGQPPVFNEDCFCLAAIFTPALYWRSFCARGVIRAGVKSADKVVSFYNLIKVPQHLSQGSIYFVVTVVTSHQ